MFFKTICILALALTSVVCVPVESPANSKGLDRPSPINPDVLSDPKPKDVSASAPTSSPDTGSHVQKIPAKGEKLSSELDQHKKTPKSDTTSEDAASKPTLRRDQATSTAAPKQPATSTREPVSLKTPVAHPSNTKVKREVESEANATTTTTTRAPIPSSSNDGNDNSAPHFVRPVPVEQILKNIHDAPKHHEPSQVVALHERENEYVTPDATTASSSASDDETKPVNDHKVHRVPFHKRKDSDDEDDKSSEEDKSDEKDN